MDQKKYKSQFKPASCGRAPWASVIPAGQRDTIMRQIRIECVQIYGYEMDVCPSKSVCIGKSCLGRELPHLSPTAKPYLNKMKLLGMLKEDLYYVEDCNTCPIKTNCTSVCPQMNDFLNRHQTKQPEIVYQDSMENYSTKGPERPVMPSELTNLELPWDCIDSSKAKIVRLRLDRRLDFLTIANKCKLFDQKDARYEFYAALTKLSEYAIVRQFLQEKESILTDWANIVLKSKYIDNMSLDDIAKKFNVSYDSIRNIIYKTLKTNNVVWPKYVKKKNGKVVYNIPEVLQ